MDRHFMKAADVETGIVSNHLLGSSRRLRLMTWLISATLFVSMPAAIVAHAASLFSDIKATWIGWSSVKITEPGFDFGGETFVAGAPTTDGHLEWFLENGQLTPALQGHLHLNDVQDLCARMRMDYYLGGRLWTTTYGGQVCAADDKHHEWDVSLADYSSNKIDEVKVSIEKLTATKNWTIVGSQTVKLKTVHDKVKITEDGFDFGGETFVAGVPTSAGTVAWTYGGGQVTPHLTGTLHINNAASACARIRIEYFKEDDTRLEEKFGGKVCAPDNRHYTWSVDLKPYSNHELTHITISLQTLSTDNTWRTVGTTTSRYVWAPVAVCGGGDCVHTSRTEIK